MCAPALLGGLPSVKILPKTMRGIRGARARRAQVAVQRPDFPGDYFEGEMEIWEARHAVVDFDLRSDYDAMDEYLCAVVGQQFAKMVLHTQKNGKAFNLSRNFQCLFLDLNVVKQWPHVRPHWRRFRRRICDNCPACAHLGEPRYMVCSGCGVARYCSEQCQREHWPFHQKECLACQEQADAPR